MEIVRPPPVMDRPPFVVEVAPDVMLREPPERVMPFDDERPTNESPPLQVDVEFEVERIEPPERVMPFDEASPADESPPAKVLVAVVELTFRESNAPTPATES